MAFLRSIGNFNNSLSVHTSSATSIATVNPMTPRGNDRHKRNRSGTTSVYLPASERRGPCRARNSCRCAGAAVAGTVARRRLTAQCSRRAAVCWPGAEAPAPACATASRQLQFASANAIVRRGNCRAASLRSARWLRAADWSVR
jgi:hypothetical protein